MGRMEWTRARNVISRVILCRWNEPLHSRSLGRQGTHPKAVRCMLPVSGRLDRTGLVVSMAQAPRVWRPRLPIRQTNRIGRARRETSPAFGAGDRPASPRHVRRGSGARQGFGRVATRAPQRAASVLYHPIVLGGLGLVPLRGRRGRKGRLVATGLLRRSFAEDLQRAFVAAVGDLSIAPSHSVALASDLLQAQLIRGT